MEYPREVVRKKVDKKYLEKFLNNPFKEVIKFVVDVKRRLVALGGELHSDAEELLIEDGSHSQDLWGGNFYPLKERKEDKTEYSSLINIKPSQNNYSMEMHDPEVVRKINQIIEELISL